MGMLLIECGTWVSRVYSFRFMNAPITCAEGMNTARGPPVSISRLGHIWGGDCDVRGAEKIHGKSVHVTPDCPTRSKLLVQALYVVCTSNR